MKKSKGITLIALIITIIVLIILAGVSINILLSKDGIINRAKQAKVDTIHAKVYETLGLVCQDYYIESQTGTTEYEALGEYLISKGIIEIIDGNIVVNTEVLLGKREEIGNGTVESGDIYVIELEPLEMAKVATIQEIQMAEGEAIGPTDSEINYKLVYYGKNYESQKNLGYLLENAKNVSSQIVEPKNIGDWIYEPNNEDPDTWTITGYKGNDTEVIVPNTIRGKKVKKVGPKTWYINDAIASLWSNEICTIEKLYSGSARVQRTIKKVIISNGIEQIDEFCFAYTKELKEVSIPSSVTKIGKAAFSSCSKLEFVNISDSITEIGDSAFADNSSLKSVAIPNSVEYIGASAFVDINDEAIITCDFKEKPINWSSFWTNCQNIKWLKANVEE